MPTSKPNDEFVWIGTSGASWTDAANWMDLTTGQNPSPVAPDAGSIDEIDGTAAGLVVAGPAVAGTLTVGGTAATSVALTGTLSADAIAVANFGDTLVIEGQAIAAALTEAAGSTVEALGSGNTLVVSSATAVAGTVLAMNSAQIRLGDTILAGGTLAGQVNGGVSIGAAPDYTAGVHVQTGATLSGTGTLLGNYLVSENSSGQEILDTNFSDLTIDGRLDATDVTALGQLSGHGTIEVLAGGAFRSPIRLDNGPGGAALTFEVDAGGLLELPATTVGAGDRIALQGTATTLDFHTRYQVTRLGQTGVDSAFQDPYVQQTSIGATITGLANSDHFVFGITDAGGSASVSQSGTQVSVLSQSGKPEATLTFDAIPTGTQFLLTPTYLFFQDRLGGHYAYQGLTQIDALPTATFAPGTGGDATWRGTGSGAFDDPANWIGGIAPGAAATAAIAGPDGTDEEFTVVAQTGQVATLDLSGFVALHGTFTADAVDVAAGAGIQLSQDTVLATQSLNLTGSNATVVSYGNATNAAGGSLRVAGTIDLGVGNTLAAEYGGRVQAQQIVLGGDDDVEVEDTAATTIDPFGNGGTLISDGSAITIGTEDDAATGTLRIDADGVLTQTGDHVLLTASKGFEIDGRLDAFTMQLLGSLTGTGSIEVTSGGDLQLGSGGLQADAAIAFTIDAGATLQAVAAAYGAGTTFTFDGVGASLALGELGSASTPFIASTISGFGRGDLIELGSIGLPATVASTEYVQTGAAGGTLELLDANGREIGSLALAGNYAGQTFLVVPVSPIETDIALAEPGIFPPSPGTATGDAFTFKGLSGANLADAANWTDDTTGSAALVAPGPLDGATIVGGSTVPTIVTGPSNVNSLALSADVALFGDVAAQTLQTPDLASLSLLIGPGGALRLGQAQLSSFAPSITVDGSGSLEIAGTLSDSFLYSFAVPSLTVQDGGTARIGTAGDGIRFFIEGDSTLQIGSGVGADPPDGFGGAVLFSGTGGTLAIGTATSTSIRLADMNGFVAGDTLEIAAADPVASVEYAAGSSTSGTLTYLDADGVTIGSTQLVDTTPMPEFIVELVGPNEVAITEQAPCFATGTRIATPDGERPVETLADGDLVTTTTGPARVTWIGHRRASDTAIVRIRTGTLGAVRDLIVSVDHALHVDGVLVPAGLLTDGVGLVREHRDAVTFWHVELDRHAILIADGVEAESYLDTGNRRQFGNCPLAYDPIGATAEPCADLVLAGSRLDDIRSRMLTPAPA